MFFTRLISGIVLVLAAIFVFVQGGYFLLFALGILSLLGLYELLRVLQMEKSSLAVVTYVATAVYYSMLCIYGGIDWLLLGLLIFMMLALLVIYVFSYPKLRIEDITKAVFVFLYVSVLFSYIARTRDLVSGNWLVWLIIISAWGSDTFAYVTGVLIGKHHFSELSPKKTVEGCIGGVVGAGLLGFCYAFFFPEYAAFTANPYIVFPLVTVIGALISQVGDLTASAIKRNYEIKDYGKIIPGHGGVLDRFDSVIFVAPFVYYLLALTMNLG